MATTTRSRAARPASPPPASFVDAAELKRLKLSPEVAWYLTSRGIPLPTCPPAIKTPEAGEVLRGARFDPERVDRVLQAFHLLRHTQGQWAGQPLRPDPWQIAYILAPVFGWVKRNGAGQWVRVVREAYIDVPRKNGKSTLCGGVGIYLTAADGEPGAQVLAAATTERQANFVFGPVKHLAEKSPALKPHIKPFAKKLIHPVSNSYFECISSTADAQHGGNIHGAVVDELHVHDDPELVETIETGTGSRRQPLIFLITTADDGKPNSIYARKRQRVEQLANRVFKHPASYGVVFAADKDDDPFAEETWRKANPGFGISPTKEYLADAAAKAQQTPAELSKFLRLHLGIRTKQATKYIQLGAWDRSAGLVDEDQLAGRRCHGGLDLSSVEDITALCWTFPPDEETPDYASIWRFWLPEARLDAMNKRTAGAAEVWVREGWLKLIPGEVIDNDFVLKQVDQDAQKFEVVTLGFDRWGAKDIVKRLEDEGLTVVGVGQGYQHLSAPTKRILELVLKGEYRHGGNPVMRWMVDNLAVRMDPSGNVKPDKDRSGDKIDGVSAAATAMAEVLDSATADDGESIYEDQDLEFG